MPHPKLHILLLASRFGMPYRVLRCARAGGAKIFVLGSAAANGLHRSRFCTQFQLAATPIDGARSEALAAEINQITQRFGIDVVLAGDAPATRSLIASADLLLARSFPMPGLADFDLLNNKWTFTQLCQSLGVQCPKTWLFAKASELVKFLAADEERGTFIAKPLSMDSSKGVVTLRSSTVAGQAAKLTYRPIVLQEFIEGQDIGASVFCRNGQVEQFIAHHYARGTYAPFTDPRIKSDLQAVLGSLKTTGIFNFDMRRTTDGRVFYLECNPRVFWKISMSMMAGVNFITAGLEMLGLAAMRPAPERLKTVLFPKALLLQTATAPWQLRAASAQMLEFLCADPVPYYREILGLERDPAD